MGTFLNGQWLKNARKRAGFARQEDLAREMGTVRGAVGNWESGRSVPDMANAERLAVLLKRPRSEVMAKFGYPIGGGGEPVAEPLPELPAAWLAVIRTEIAAGVADGIAQVVADLRAEGLLSGPAGAARGPSRPRAGGSARPGQ